MPEPKEQGLTSRAGAIEIDWPRSIGYFGGVALAVAFELIEPPLGLFIVAIPFIKLLNRPQSPRPARFVAQLLDGAAKPLGGDGDSTIRLTTPDVPGLPKERQPSQS